MQARRDVKEARYKADQSATWHADENFLGELVHDLGHASEEP